MIAAIRPLGELEALVMDRLWDKGPAGAARLQKIVGESRGITLNTIQSTVERLYRKGFLSREKVSHAYLYTVCISREELAARLVERLVGDLVGSGRGALLPTFVDLAARAGEEELARLERLVVERRKRGK